MKKNIKKISIVSMLIMIFTVIMVPIKSQAGFQANKGGTSKDLTSANNFFIGIRNMEKEGGTLGLTAQLEETSYLDTTGNGLDCHMAKNTEWGTAAMLSASLYGSPTTGTSNLSTTGNDSGVFQMADGRREYVAGLWDTTNSNIDIIKNSNERYFNLYTEAIEKFGDATKETIKWKNSSEADFVSGSSPIFGRGKGMFGYGSLDGAGHNYLWGSGTSEGSRAAIVCGDGL